MPPDTGWQPAHPGLELRSLDVAAGDDVERVVMARLDPAQVTLRVSYRPGIAYPVSAWAHTTGALLTVNGSYFKEEDAAIGLTVAGGVASGATLPDYAGMLAVAADGAISVRWLRDRPYDPAEGLREAVQAFPVLVKPGGVMGFPADGDDGRASRRTVVAQDREGRILLLMAPRGYLSLHEAAVWLAGSDLGIDVALNLDGGTSSGFWLKGGVQFDSFVPVPVVVGVYPREG